MATANELIRRALRLLGVLAVGQTPSADDVAVSLESLNAMLKQWYVEGIRIGDYSVAVVGTVVTTDPGLDNAISYNLAFDLIPEFGVAANQAQVSVIVARAPELKELARSLSLVVPAPDFGFLPTPSADMHFIED